MCVGARSQPLARAAHPRFRLPRQAVAKINRSPGRHRLSLPDAWPSSCHGTAHKSNFGLRFRRDCSNCVLFSPNPLQSDSFPRLSRPVSVAGHFRIVPMSSVIDRTRTTGSCLRTAGLPDQEAIGRSRTKRTEAVLVFFTRVRALFDRGFADVGAKLECPLLRCTRNESAYARDTGTETSAGNPG
jgi:hypothetical protein